MGFSYNVNVLNQKGSPAIYTDTFANRPAFGFAGRLFISNDTAAIYEDTGTAWVLIANVSSGAGTLQQVTTNGNTSNVGISVTAGGVSTNSATITSLTQGSVPFVGTAGLITQDNTNLFFDDTNNRLGINTNTPSNNLDVHSTGTIPIIAINNTAGNQSLIGFAKNSTAKWRIGNSSTDTFDVLNVGTGTNAISIDSSTNLVSLIGALNAAGSITSQVNNSNFGTSANGQIPITIQSNATARVLRLKNSAAGYSDITVDGTASSSIFGINTFSTNDAFKIIDNGNIGIGNALPTRKLDVSGTGRFTGILRLESYLEAMSSPSTSAWIIARAVEIVGGGNDMVLYTQSGLAMQFWTNGVKAATISTAQNFLIGSAVDDTVNKLQVTGSGTFSSSLKVGTTIGIGVDPDSVVGLFIKSTGTTSATYAILTRDSSNNNIFVVRDNGEVTISNLAGTGSRAVLASATGVLSAPVSDISVKENIESLKYGLDTIMKLNPVQFKFIEGYKNYGEGLQIGAIAQEVEQIIPEAVFKTPSTGLKGIDYNQFNGIYIKAIQDQQKIIDSLIKRIELLENK